MNKKKITILLTIMALFTLTGCTKTLKNSDNKVVQNSETGQTLIKNILCQPENEIQAGTNIKTNTTTSIRIMGNNNLVEACSPRTLACCCLIS